MGNVSLCYTPKTGIHMSISENGDPDWRWNAGGGRGAVPKEHLSSSWRSSEDQDPIAPRSSHLQNHATVRPAPVDHAAPRGNDLTLDDARADKTGIHMSISENGDPDWTMAYVQNLPNRYGPATILNLLLMNYELQNDPDFQFAVALVFSDTLGDSFARQNLLPSGMEDETGKWLGTVEAALGEHCPPFEDGDGRQKVSGQEIMDLVAGPWQSLEWAPRGVVEDAGRGAAGDGAGGGAGPPRWAVEDVNQALSAETHPDVVRVCNFFSLTRNRAAPKNAGYAFLSFRSRALMEAFARVMEGKCLTPNWSKPLRIRLGSLKNLRGAEEHFPEVVFEQTMTSSVEDRRVFQFLHDHFLFFSRMVRRKY